MGVELSDVKRGDVSGFRVYESGVWVRGWD